MLGFESLVPGPGTAMDLLLARKDITNRLMSSIVLSLVLSSLCLPGPGIIVSRLFKRGVSSVLSCSIGSLSIFSCVVLQFCVVVVSVVLAIIVYFGLGRVIVHYCWLLPGLSGNIHLGVCWGCECALYVCWDSHPMIKLL